MSSNYSLVHFLMKMIEETKCGRKLMILDFQSPLSRSRILYLHFRYPHYTRFNFLSNHLGSYNETRDGARGLGLPHAKEAF